MWQSKWRHLLAKLPTNTSIATWWLYLQPMQVAPMCCYSCGAIFAAIAYMAHLSSFASLFRLKAYPCSFLVWALRVCQNINIICLFENHLVSLCDSCTPDTLISIYHLWWALIFFWWLSYIWFALILLDLYFYLFKERLKVEIIDARCCDVQNPSDQIDAMQWLSHFCKLPLFPIFYFPPFQYCHSSKYDHQGCTRIFWQL